MKNRNNNNIKMFTRTEKQARELAMLEWQKWTVGTKPTVMMVPLCGIIGEPFIFVKRRISQIQVLNFRVVLEMRDPETKKFECFFIVECATNNAARKFAKSVHSAGRHTFLVGRNSYRKFVILESGEKGAVANSVCWLGPDMDKLDLIFYEFLPCGSFEALCHGLTPDENGEVMIPILKFRLFFNPSKNLTSVPATAGGALSTIESKLGK